MNDKIQKSGGNKKRNFLRNNALFRLSYPGFFLMLLVVLTFPFAAICSSGFVNDLRSNGYSLIPAPQEAYLSGKNIGVNGSWKIISNVSKDNIAFKKLKSGAINSLGLEFTGKGVGEIILEVKPGVIKKGIDKVLANQGYRLDISPGKVRITGNGESGLFYGVQSLLQLLRPANSGGFTLPEGTINDWPDLQMRSVHWDTKHHQDRIETLKRFLDESAYFKVNTILFEIEDKYEYPSHPIIGAPCAFTKAEMHELCAYALERYIQIIPVIQAPSHMGYVLKHEEFAHLRADGMNYQVCMCDEEAVQLIFDMYQDMIDATPGMDYLYISTDELYYPGICDKCKNQYNDVNRSQTWVDFVNRAFQFLSTRNRQALAYVMPPLLIKDIVQLPSGLITPIRDVEETEWINNLKETGIKQIAYSPMQGNEFLFPNYFRTQFRGEKLQGRLIDAYNTIPKTLENKAELMGTFAAAWDDAGLHNETFWLGWATVTQYGWSIGKPGLDQSTADFMDAFYGYDSPNMVEAYKLLQEGARFYEDLWDRVPSKERDPGYGSSRGKGFGVDRFDQTLELPPLPTSGDINISPEFNDKYASKIKEASRLIQSSDKLIGQLQHNLSKVSRNRYNLEILLSIAYLERFTINTVLNLSKLELLLEQASAARSNFKRVVNNLVEAHKLVDEIKDEEKAMWSKFTEVWETGRLPKGQSVDGKDFAHMFDDVKDHFAARRLGLEYMIAPFERMKLEKWQKQLETIINNYAKAKNVPIKGFASEVLED